MPPSQSPTRNRAASAAHYRIRPTMGRGPRYGILLSALFHGAIFAAAYITFQHNFQTPEETHIVPVDLVTIAAVTNVAAQAPPTPDLPKPVTPDTTPVPPPEPRMQEAEPAPVPPMPKFDIAKPEKEKPVEDDTPKPPTKKQQREDFANLLDQLTAPEKPAKKVKPGTRVIQGVGLGSAMTASLADALRNQIYRCWSPPTGAPPDRANDLVVDYDLRLNPDGTVASAALQTEGSSAYTRAAASAASRAIYQCQPYRLPQERYNDWREISPLRFDPRALLEQ